MIAVLLAAIATPADAAVVELTPGSPWTLDRSEEGCEMSRTYASPGGDITLYLTPATLGTGIGLGLAGAVSPAEARPAAVTIGLPPQGTGLKMERSAIARAGDKASVRWHRNDGRTGPDEVVAAIFAVGAIEVPLRGRTLRMPLGSTDALWRALRACHLDLAQHWGLDPAAVAAIARPARAPGVQWVLPDDVPPDAIRAETVGDTRIVWQIGTDGRIEDCRVVQSSGHRSLDEAACGATMRRGSYSEPARDGAGRAVVSWQSRPVRWRLPR